MVATFFLKNLETRRSLRNLKKVGDKSWDFSCRGIFLVGGKFAFSMQQSLMRLLYIYLQSAAVRFRKSFVRLLYFEAEYLPGKVAEFAPTEVATVNICELGFFLSYISQILQHNFHLNSHFLSGSAIACCVSDCFLL